MELTSDVWIPLVIVGVCAALALIVHLLTRTRPTSISVPAGDDAQWNAAINTPLIEPDTSVEQTRLLSRWHHTYGGSVRSWVENHERILDQVSNDSALRVDAIDPATSMRHEQLAPIIKEAINEHPAPAMQAELSALVVASQATLHALHRNDYDAAGEQHLTYLDYRDTWLDRLRQFSSDSASGEIRSMANQQPATPGWDY